MGVDHDGDDFIKGGAYGDTLWGGDGNDTINGGKGGDLLVGGSGNDTFIIELNSGVKRIDDESGYDTIQFGEGIDKSQFSTCRGTLNDTDMDVLIDGQLVATVAAFYYPNGGYTIEKVIFADGQSIALDKISNIVNGTSGNDYLNGHNGVDEFRGGAGNDNFYGGGGGSDLYIFNIGDGIDTIQDYRGVADTIIMGTGITSSNIRIEKNAVLGGDLIIYYGVSDQITISMQFYGEGYVGNHDREVEFLKFADGTSVSLLNNLTFKGTSGNDQVYGALTNDVLLGFAGDDNLDGSEGDDSLTGGAGSDTLIGGAGNDTYVFNIGDGVDTIQDYRGVADTIIMGTGITSSNIRIEKNAVLGGDLIIYYGVSDQITISMQFYGEGYVGNHDREVEFLKFADGSVISLLMNMTFKGTVGNDQVYGTLTNDVLLALAGDDNLDGSEGNDSLTGGTGSDTLIGGAGNDTYVFNIGDGVDTIYETSGTDTILMGAGITSNNIRLEKGSYLGGSLVIYYGTSDQVTISSQYYAEGYLGVHDPEVEFIKFSDGTSISLLGGMTFYGTSGNDIVSGSSMNDTLIGLAGGDTLNAGGGNDLLDGGAGDDYLDGGDGNDTATYAGTVSAVTVDLTLTTAQNTVGAGNDSLYSIENLIGSSYNDTLTGDGNANIIEGGLGNDILNGGAGTDTVSYASSTAGVTVNLATTTAQNTVGAGNDTITAFENILGSAYNDTLTGDGNANVIEGGLGNDVLNGGAGTDTVSYASSTAGVTVNLATSTAQNTVGAGTDTITAFENILGSAYNDTLTGDANANTITGGDGNDTIQGGLGNDVLIGGNGIDTISYSAATAAVTFSLATTTAQNTVNAGTDTVSGFENILGSAYNDTLTGDGNANVIEGGLGNDAMNGGAGIDTVSYLSATAAVTVNLATTTAQNTVGAGTDTITNFENILGSAYNDTLMGDGNANIIEGGLGNDVMNGGAGIDTVSYVSATAGITVNLATTTAQNTVGAGTDTISNFENILGSAYNDTLTGNSGANVIDGGDGNDIIEGGLGNDTINGNAGIDTASYATATAGVTVNLGITTSQNTVSAGTDILIGIENLTGSAYNDILNGDANSNVINGGNGNDIIDGGLGNDTLNGGAGTDTVSYATATASVTLNLATTTAQNTIGAGTDTITAFENILGSAYNDTLTGDGNANVIDGGDGNDIIEGGLGNDTINGNAGIDTASYATATAGVTVNLGIATAQNTVSAGTDILMGIENLTGSAYNDNLTGDANANVINSGNGDDIIEGGLGDDILNGGSGTDTVSYQSSASGVIVSLALTASQNTVGAGLDTLTNFENILGSAYSDILTGDAAANTITGGDGDDIIQGGLGNDVLAGGNGIDTVSYSAATSAVTVNLATTTAQNTVSAGSDTLSGFENILGSAYNDTLTGDGNANIIEGGLGNDVMNGAAGIDTVSYVSATAGVTVNLATTTAQNTVGAGTDTITNFENILGSAYNDTLTGDANDNTITGGDGNDIIQGGLGNDILLGGYGIDTATYSAASAGVTVNLGISTAQNTISAGTDILMGIENLTGSAYGDTLTGNGADNVIDGGTGNDIIDGGLGNDVLNGNSGTDTVSYASITQGVTVNLSTTTAQDTIGAGLDTLINFENMLGSSYNDILTGNSGTNIIDGGLGNDVMDGGAGIDTISYASFTKGVSISLAVTAQQNTVGAGLDTITNFENILGSAYSDILTGDAAANTITGGDGDDIIQGGLGNDVLAGGNGVDTVSYSAATAAATVNLATTTAQNTVSAGSDTLSGFENILGSVYNDTLTGDGNTNVIEGGLGNDVMNGAGGIDTVSYVSAAAGVTVNLATTTAQNTVGAGTDTITNFENILGSSYNDTLTGNSADNTIEGGLGNDVMNGGAGIDTVSYASATAAVTVNLSLTTAQNTVGAGTDTLSNFENIFASAYDDILTGSSAANTINGGAGNDLINGGLGADTFRFSVAGLDTNFDRITDFSTSQGDKIDVKDLLVGYDPVTKAITDFVEFTTVGTNTVVKVDRDGTGTTYGWQQIAQLDNLTGLTDEAALKASGNLIVA